MCRFKEENKIWTLATWLTDSKYTVILTGAGMSTESGVPDFRSVNGLWKKYNPRALASVEALEDNYHAFHDFYKRRIEGLAACEPHEGHRILAEWERREWVHCIVTQNVDRFHQQAGSKKVYELHGNIQTVRCQGCGKPSSVRRFLNMESCEFCEGRLRPNVVLFGETLPQQAWTLAVKAMGKASLVLVIGTSLEVYPANQLPFMSKGKIVVINREMTEGEKNCDLLIRGEAGRVLQDTNDCLNQLK